MNAHNLSKYPTIQFDGRHNSCVTAIIELTDGTLVSCANDGTIRRWTAQGQLLNLFLANSSVVSCLMEVNNNMVLTNSDYETMNLWNLTTGECLLSLSTSSESIWCLLRLKQSSSFLCGMDSGCIQERVMDNNYSFETLDSKQLHSDRVLCLCELRNGWIVSGSADETLKVWEMQSNNKTVLHTLEGHSDSIHRVIELQGSYHTIASGSDDRTVRIWAVATGQCLRVLNEHMQSVRGLVELSDGVLLSGSWGELIVWTNPEERVVSCKLPAAINCIVGLRDGSIVTGSIYGDIELRKTWMRYQQTFIMCLV